MTATDENVLRIRHTVEACLRAVLPLETPMPADDDDWTESGLLDSMAHVDLLLAIETALEAPKLFGGLGVSPPSTLRAAVETIASALAASVQSEITESRILLPAKVASSAGLVGWGTALGANRIPVRDVEQNFHLSSAVLAKSAGIVSVCHASAGEDEVILGTLAAQQAFTSGKAFRPKSRLDHRHQRNLPGFSFLGRLDACGSLGFYYMSGSRSRWCLHRFAERANRCERSVH